MHATFILPPWKPLEDEAASQRLADVMSEWLGTRYLPGSGSKGAYTDCVGFVIGVASDLERRVVVRSHLPQDSAFHVPDAARAGMREIMRLFPNWKRVLPMPPASMLPGDVLAVGPHNGGPGHGMFVSPWPNQLIHATPNGVHLTPMSSTAGFDQLFAIYRPQDVSSWL